MAEALLELRAFVYVSTAFVNGHQPQVPFGTELHDLFQRPGLGSSSSTCISSIRAATMDRTVTLCMLCTLRDLQIERVMHHQRADSVAASAGLQGGRAPVLSVR